MAQRKQRGRKFMVEDTLIDEWGAILTARAFRVYIAYCRHRNRETSEAYPSIRTLKRLLSMGTTQVEEAIQELVHYDLLTPIEWDNKKYKKYKINQIPEIVEVGNRSYLRNSEGDKPFRRWEQSAPIEDENKTQRLKNLNDRRNKANRDRSDARNVPISGSISLTVPSVGSVDAATVPSVGTEVKEREEKTEEKKTNTHTQDLTPKAVPGVGRSNPDDAKAEPGTQDNVCDSVQPFEPEIPEYSPNGALPTDPSTPNYLSGVFDRNEKSEVLAFAARVDALRNDLFKTTSTWVQAKRFDPIVYQALEERGISFLMEACDHIQESAASIIKKGKADEIDQLRRTLTPHSICRRIETIRVEMQERESQGGITPAQAEFAERLKDAIRQDVADGYYSPEVESHLDRIVLLTNDEIDAELAKFKTGKEA